MKPFVLLASLLIIMPTFMRCQASDRPLQFGDIVVGEYNHLQPPMVDDKPAVIYVRLVLIKIRDMDVSDMIYTADMMFSQFWTDHRLRIPKWLNKSSVLLDYSMKDDLWLPKIMFKNAVEETAERGLWESFYMKLMKNSKVHLKCRASVKFICNMDLHHFPHDLQVCGMILMSELYTTDQLVIKWDTGTAFRGSVHLILPQFHIEKIEVIDCCNYTYDYGSFSCVEGKLHLQRLVGFFFINIYIPTILIVSMSMLTFWIPPQAVPARITLGVTSLLTMITKQYGADMPNVSYVIALNVWLSSCIGFVFSSLVEYAIVIVLSAGINLDNDPSKSSFQGNGTPVVAFSRTNSNESKRLQRAGSPLSLIKVTPKNIDMVSRFLFPFLFVVYCIIYFVSYS